jgi:hypothetical protein
MPRTWEHTEATQAGEVRNGRGFPSPGEVRNGYGHPSPEAGAGERNGYGHPQTTAIGRY